MLFLTVRAQINVVTIAVEIWSRERMVLCRGGRERIYLSRDGRNRTQALRRKSRSMIAREWTLVVGTSGTMPLVEEIHDKTEFSAVPLRPAMILGTR